MTILMTGSMKNADLEGSTVTTKDVESQALPAEGEPTANLEPDSSHDQQDEPDSGGVLLESLPPMFYCPLTKRVMEDPVVIPDGTTYERSAAVAKLSAANESLYPNRALKSIIDETMAMHGDSLVANMKRLQHTMGQTLNQLIDKSVIPAIEHHELPEAYYCPITFNLMHDPVIDPEGNTYERVAVENWIRANQNSPISRTDLSLEQIYPNSAIKDLMTYMKNKPEQEMHPAIKKWKDETPPDASDPEVGENLETNNRNGNNQANDRYPTTYTELDRRRAMRRRAVFNFVGILFAILCLVGFVMYGGLILLMLFCITLMLVFNRRDARR